jgi:steroid delta-isomerase-like uncharacterized protein
MSTEQNKALLRRIFDEGLDQNKPGVFDELIAPDFVIYDPPLGMQPNREGFRQILAKFREALPDVHLTIEDEFADGDYVIQRISATGTHKGEFQGLPPTGKKVKVNGIHIWRFANGKVAVQQAPAAPVNVSAYLSDSQAGCDSKGSHPLDQEMIWGPGAIFATITEDRMLREELAGYAEYAAKVRYRLIPGVW